MLRYNLSEHDNSEEDFFNTQNRFTFQWRKSVSLSFDATLFRIELPSNSNNNCLYYNLRISFQDLKPRWQGFEVFRQSERNRGQNLLLHLNYLFGAPWIQSFFSPRDTAGIPTIPTIPPYISWFLTMGNSQSSFWPSLVRLLRLFPFILGQEHPHPRMK